jgi:hypothetical protein
MRHSFPQDSTILIFGEYKILIVLVFSFSFFLHQ